MTHERVEKQTKLLTEIQTRQKWQELVTPMERAFVVENVFNLHNITKPNLP